MINIIRKVLERRKTQRLDACEFGDIIQVLHPGDKACTWVFLHRDTESTYMWGILIKDALENAVEPRVRIINTHQRLDCRCTLISHVGAKRIWHLLEQEGLYTASHRMLSDCTYGDVVRAVCSTSEETVIGIYIYLHSYDGKAFGLPFSGEYNDTIMSPKVVLIAGPGCRCVFLGRVDSFHWS